MVVVDNHRLHAQAYIRSCLNTAIYVLDFLKHGKARGDELRQVEELIGAMSRLLVQVRARLVL